MLPAEAPQAYNFAVPSRIVLWQHVGDHKPLSGITKEKWSAVTGTLSCYARPLATRPLPPHIWKM